MQTSPVKSVGQLKIQLTVIEVIAETARTAGSLGAPAGPIYAALMGLIPSITPDYFDACVKHLVNAGLVSYRNDLIVWL